MSVSDKKKLFESAMEEHMKPSPKSGDNTFTITIQHIFYISKKSI